MKISKFILVIAVCFNLSRSYAQIGHQRGLYVNDFIILDGSDEIDLGKSILGNIGSENQLLKYCMQNHITYITLYNLRNIWINSDPLIVAANENLLYDFICKAKEEYCIEKVGGVVGGFATAGTVPSWLRQTPPFTFGSSWTSTDLYSRLSYLEDEITHEDPGFRNAEDIKLALRLMGVFGTGSTPPNCAHIDILSIEYEFWNNEEYDDGSSSTFDFVDLLEDIDFARDDKNNLSTLDTYVEVYLDELNDANGSKTSCQIANYIDNDYTNSYSNTVHRVDRILGTAYHDYGDNLYNPDISNHANAHAADYANKFLLFCNTLETSGPSYSSMTGTNLCGGISSYSTNDNTNYEPIFHSGDVPNGALGNFLGTYIPLSNDRNIFTIERKFYDDFIADNNHSNIHDASIGNDVAPGGAQWYTSGFMLDKLANPITFLAYATSCPSGTGAQNVTLDYQGPIEAGISYSYTVANCLTNSIITGPMGSSGTTPLYTGDYTSSEPGVGNVVYSLLPGTYCISLNLNYASGCGYTYTQKINVSSNFLIQSLNHPGNTDGPFTVCSGEHILLQANLNIPGATYQWYNNGYPIAGANSYQYSAEISGNYVCILSGTCSGTSNTISILVNDNPFRTIVAGCPSSAGNVSLNVVPVTTNDTYLWSTSATTSTISVSTDGVYSVSVTSNGCTRTVTQEVTTVMLNGFTVASPPALETTFPPAPLGTGSVFTGSVCPGTLVRIRPSTTSSLSLQIWSTGATSGRILVNQPGNYFAIFEDANQCEISSNITLSNYSPSVSINNDEAPTKCLSGNIPLTAVGSGATSYAYTWNPINICSPCNTQTISNPNITETTNVSVISTDNLGCISMDATTYTIVEPCVQISKTVNTNKQYPTMPVAYTINVCNTLSIPATYTVFDDVTAGVSINNIWQDPFNSTGPWPGYTASPITTSSLDQYECESFKIICSYNEIGDQCNTAEILEINGNPVTAPIQSDVCFKNLVNCPMSVMCKVRGCEQNQHAMITLLNHAPLLPELSSFKARLIYPNFLTPSAIGDYSADPVNYPSALSNPIVPDATSTVSNLDVAHSTMSIPMPHSGSPGGYFVNYNYVDVEIHYTTPMASPHSIGSFDFVFNSDPPVGINSFHVFVVDPVSGEENHTHLELTSNNSVSYWTQAVGAYIPSCTYVTEPDADFEIEYMGCGGLINVKSNYTGNDYASKWEFGDERTTPIFGSKDWTYDYFSPISTYTGSDGTQTTFSPAIPSAGPGTYTITHTVYDQNGNVGVSTQEIIISESCCSITPEISLEDKAVSSEIAEGLVNTTIHIEGEFIIDKNFYLNNCIVTAGVGAVIKVLQDQTFSFFNTHFMGCDAMWQGIISENNSTVITDGGSSISDAQTGFYAPNPDGYFYFQGCEFKDNVIGIYSPPSPSDEYSNVDFMLIGNRFLSTGSFKPDYDGQDAHPNFSKAGVELNNMVGFIGSNGYGTNHFEQLNSGILLNHSNIVVENNDFKNIHTESFESYPTLGAGIISIGQDAGYYALEVAPKENQSLSHPTFYNCDIGILSMQEELYVHDNTMVDVEKGVVATNTSNDYSVEVNENNIHAQERGIQFIENPGSNHLTANNNFIITESPLGIGIEAAQSSENDVVLSIIGNSIYGKEHLSGIKATNIDGETNIVENYITTLSAYGNESSGIEIEGCSNGTIGCNDIRGVSDYLTYGIHQSSSQYFNVHCNKVDASYTGIEFDGVNPSTHFEANEMYEHYEGLHLNSSAVIDQQIQSGNKWFGPYGLGSSSYGAINLNYTGQSLSTFEIDPSSGTEYNPSIPSANSGWFDPQSGTPISCENFEDCTRPTYREARLGLTPSQLDIDIANENILTVDFTPESQNIAKHYLFEKLTENPSLLSDTLMNTFHDSLISKPISDFSDIKKNIKILNSTTTIRGIMNYGQILITNYRDSLHLIDSIRIISGNSSNLDSLSKSLHKRINLQHNIIKSSIDQYLNGRLILKSNIETNNNNATSSEITELNEKLINEIDFVTDASGIHTYNSAQEAQLLSIAQQCPFSGGEAVYKARVKYKKIYPNTFFNDRNTCLAEGIYRKSHPKHSDDESKIRNSSFRLWPNPAHDIANVEFYTISEEGGKLQIIDLAGKVIQEIKLSVNTNHFTLETRNLPTGMYIVKLLDGSNLVGKCKMGINR